MAAKRDKTSKSSDAAPPNLTVSRVEAEEKIVSRIETGTELINKPIQSEEDLDKARHEYYTWNDFNKELLRRIFDSPEVSEEYSRLPAIVVFPDAFHERVKDHIDDIIEKVRRLESIRERLSLYSQPFEPSTTEKTTAKSEPVPTTKTVFVVHGRDEDSKDAVARFLEKLELKPVILHEQPNRGRTILEKLEDYSTVTYAVVLLTPDDICGLTSNRDKMAPRARQNVVFELGYFIGKLGRARVCALHNEDVELPSDFAGVVYIPFDRHGAWKLLLAREIKAAGLDIDLNKAL